MAAARLLSMSRPSWTALGIPSAQRVSGSTRFGITCMASGFGFEKSLLVGQDIERKPLAEAKAATNINMVTGLLVEPIQTSKGVDHMSIPLLMVFVRSISLYTLKVTKRRTSWSSIIQSLLEKVIMDTRFFTLLGVAGTLLGSVLCFLEGVFLVAESYLQYFHALYHHSDHGHIMYLLIEALDMFLVGTAMLTFGMGLHVMFIGTRASKAGSPLPSSNFFGLFYLKEFPSWAGMKSMNEAKSKMGHAITLLLQAGILDKFKSVPLVTGLDLACFAAAVFVSSLALFLLSRLSSSSTASFPTNSFIHYHPPARPS